MEETKKDTGNELFEVPGGLADDGMEEIEEQKGEE